MAGGNDHDEQSAATKCWCPGGPKSRGWASYCPVHGCPAKDYTEAELKTLSEGARRAR